MTTNVRRSGFTLPEILVTVTIVAVLAAVVVPAVVQQVNKANAPAASSDMIGIRTAINSFATDTRHFPRYLSQLNSSTLAATDSDVSDAAFGSDAANFHGPYLSTSGKGHVTPSGVLFSNAFAVDSSRVCMVDSTGKSPRVAQVAALDSAIDNGNGATSGVVKWHPEAAGDTITAASLKVCLVGKG